ncbi:MAG: M3 family oligoendopeptidase [Clostridia bacterium]|nr:M3 family oligoendopeptidase [Clostridia bacterium]
METFRELPYQRPDFEALTKEMQDCIDALRSAQNFEEAHEVFLRWNKRSMTLETMYSIAYIRHTVNMKDDFYDGEIAFFDESIPRLTPLMKAWTAALLASPARPELEEIYGSHFFKTAEVEESLMNDEIIPDMIEENTLSSAYSKTAAACSVEFMGETCNFYGLLRHMQSTDREERRTAFRAWAKLYEDISPTLEEQYGKLVKVRCDIARKLGFDSYVDYIYPARGRYDYTAREAADFREAVRKYITPLCDEMYREQAGQLGIDELQWYDEELIFPEGNALPIGTPEELLEKAHGMYSELSPQTKEYFDFMTEHELFDLVTRENKHLGGYCTWLPDYQAPFIFSNFNGTSADVDVLTHEAGHAFEFYYACRRLPLVSMAGSTSEINEIHSMSMEHFTYPYMERFFGENADKYRYAHFCSALRSIPYLVSVDEFQHRVFEHPEAGPADWRRFWKEIEQKYMPWRRYDGNAFLESGGFWMQKQHIFLYPFYYIDYALAQMGAFSLYRRQLTSGDGWKHYLDLCAIGGKYGYFETLERAGIPVPLSDGVVKEIADFARLHAEQLKARL